MRTIKGCFVDTYASTGQFIIPSRCNLVCTYMCAKVSPLKSYISDNTDDIPVFQLMVRADDTVGACIDSSYEMIS
jgi:hypothetical protein